MVNQDARSNIGTLAAASVAIYSLSNASTVVHLLMYTRDNIIMPLLYAYMIMK